MLWNSVQIEHSRPLFNFSLLFKVLQV